ARPAADPRRAGPLPGGARTGGGGAVLALPRSGARLPADPGGERARHVARSDPRLPARAEARPRGRPRTRRRRARRPLAEPRPCVVRPGGSARLSAPADDAVHRSLRARAPNPRRPGRLFGADRADRPDLDPVRVAADRVRGRCDRRRAGVGTEDAARVPAHLDDLPGANRPRPPPRAQSPPPPLPPPP